MFKIILNTFGLIKAAHNNDDDDKFILEKPFYTENKKKIFHFKSVSEIYNLIIMWEIPNQKQFLLSKDFDILKYILLNETYNSFWFNLMNLGYITSLNIDIKYEGNFIIIFNLTQLGYDNFNNIETLLYLYLDKIYNSNFIKYVEYIKNIMDINFYHTNKIDPSTLCNDLATNHFNYKTKKVFLNSNTIKIIKSNNEYIKLFKKYINKNNFIKILVSNKFIDNLKYDKIDHYCDAYLSDITNIDISKTPINIENISYLNMPNIKSLNINVKLIKKLDIYSVPILVNNNIITEWYGGSSKFKEPIIICCLQILNNNYNNTCMNYILTNISCIILNFIVSIIFNKYFELNYSINIKTTTNSSIIIMIDGLNDLNIFKMIIYEFTNLIKNINYYFDKLTLNYVQNIILKLKNNINNITHYNPQQYFSYIINVLIYKNEYTIEELLSCLDNVTYDNIKEYIQNIFNGNLTIFSYGNLKLNPKLFIKLKQLFNNKYIINKPIINKLQSTTIVLKNKQDNLICVNFLFYIGNFEPKLYLLLNLFINIFGTIFFDKLRTDKQLGYIVKMKFVNYDNNYYIIQQILSNSPVDIIKNEIIKFNNQLLNRLTKININIYIETIKQTLDSPSNNTYELCNIYLSEILDNNYLFYRKQILLEYINEIKLNDLINFINLYININKQIIIIIE
jgi:secreted Zn-dependent insulinase-like peptidase